MKKHKNSLLFILPFILFSSLSCKSSKKVAFDPSEASSHFIQFGGGGGFTGKVTSYCLNHDGNIYAVQDKEYSKIGKISGSKTEQIFKIYTSLSLDKMTLNDPGNKYSFIERRVNNESQRLTWGKNPLDTKAIQTYYNILMKIVDDILIKKASSNTN